MTEDEEEQEPDSGEEETQVRKRKPSILRSNIHLSGVKGFQSAEKMPKKNSEQNDL